MWPNPKFPANLVTFTVEILNQKPHFSYSAWWLLGKRYNSNHIGLYRCDRSSVFKNICRQQVDKHEDIIKHFFKDIIKCILKIATMVHTTLFDKPNDNATYIDV